MQLNYLILAHKNPEQLKELVTALIQKDATFYIHIDLKSDMLPFKKQFAKFVNEKILFIQDRVNVIHGHFSQVEATLALMKAAINQGNTGYFILLSGQDYPLKSNEWIKNIFTEDPHINYINYVSMYEDIEKGTWRALHYTFHPFPTERKFYVIPSVFNYKFYHPKRWLSLFKLLNSPLKKEVVKLLKKKKIPKYLTHPSGGDQWWALPFETVQFILNFLDEHPDYLEFMKFTFCPDEMFFHSIILSYIDKQKIKPTQTYVNWSRKGCVLPVTFTSNDFDELSNVNNKLFARKFDYDLDKVILNKIESIIRV